MGEDCGTWIPKLHFDWQSPNLSSFGAPLDVGKQNGVCAAMNLGANMVTRNETMPAYVSSLQPHSQLGHSGESHGWFYCLPRFRQGFTMPAPNLTAEAKLPAGHVKDSREEIVPNREMGFPQKQFLVIDQTGDQTTLVYSSRFGSPVECLGSWDSKLHGSNNLDTWNELPSLGRDVNHVVELGTTLDDKVDENQGTDDIESEMHEDTEEINALLYSDSDGYSTEDDDEVTSTGHSPSTMTTHDNQEEPNRGIAEEVASSAGKAKKRKLLDETYDDDVQFMDTASSLNGNKPFEVGDDAESRCSSGGNCSQGSGEMGSLSCNKRMRKEKIQDVLSILQCIVPGGKDKDPIELLDEAIRCLKSLKLKVRELGLDAL
ncbi:transcription factor bHLH143-like isoform X2 [Abrus precatorius]|uniref:Transcription factor bHLH143-like isoform X2 n=1 Tax=Abrus precatorius TaxID=3816 RepID=A0A8B8JEJ8_ABRPR|nr:transcription factor bHLH143-like isoform X2 [Abrus precatorius]XP_027329649.1 transcription factor bHLH143-like isoform X2 [Abrus precatorius]